VIELKVSEDREHVLQGWITFVEWKRIEAWTHSKSKLFGERKFEESPLVYLVAPALRVHPSFQTLARCIDSDIEIYRLTLMKTGVQVCV
jgi:hypothetical protein